MKRILSYFWLLFLVVVLSACSKNTIDDKVIVVGASISPHSEILEETRSYIESKGYKLKIVRYTDYIQPNVGVLDGSLDANYFQHLPYLEEYNNTNKSNLVSVGTIHTELLAIYSGKSNSFDLNEGAVIAIPNDVTNGARALLLLDSVGLLEVDKSKGLLVTKKDILSNPLKLEIKEFEAALIPHHLADVDLGVVNGNVALSSKITDKLIAGGTEDINSIGGLRYANIIAVKAGNEDSDAIKVLLEALRQDNIKEYIISKYDGLVLPVE